MNGKAIQYLSLLIFIVVDYGFAREMPHQQLKRECRVCHITEKWDKISFDHNQTGFALDGQHCDVVCANCHTLKDFSRGQAGCKSCHLDVHQGKLAYPCEQCHTAVGWQILDIYKIHAATTFPVLGAHSRLDCAACHKSEIVGEYARLQSDCVSCHLLDYQGAKNPAHSDFGFGRRCEDCHGMLAWAPAMFADHEARFPISSGAHAGEWESCTTCHPNPKNYRDFTCFNCHEHSAANTIREHDEVRDFSYDSDACYRCHPTGRGGD